MFKRHNLPLLLTIFLFLIANFSFAQDVDHEAVGQPVNTKEEIGEAVDHHLLDSHTFDFFHDNVTGEHYGFTLPVILVDNGVHIFSAADFGRGSEVVEKNGQFYKIHGNKIYKTNAAGDLEFNESGFPTNDKPIDLSITKNVLIIFLMVLFVFFVFKRMAKGYSKNAIPKGIGRFLEPLIVFVRDDIAKESIGEKHYKKYTGFLLTLFFFILFLNLLGLFPFGVNVTGSITVTLALALITFFVTQFSGNKNYWKHIFWFPDVHPVVKIILIPIEILGMFTKPFSLMIRLFANMTAGHVMVMSFIGFIFIFKNIGGGAAFFGFTLFIYVLEILVALLQAYIFTLLSALYIAAAVEEHPVEDLDEEEIPIV